MALNSKLTYRCLVFGATGMVGQALMAVGNRRGLTMVGVARTEADLVLDLRNTEIIREHIHELAPDVVINAAAIVGIDQCERQPLDAYLINSRAVGAMAAACYRVDARFIQVSTDHFFCGEGDIRHREDAPITLVNEYARTKYLGECLALTESNGKALIIRTNVTGIRGNPEQPTFIEWAVTALLRRAPMTLFNDYFTSTMATREFSNVIFDLVDTSAAGVLNVASRETVSKKEFIELLAIGLSIDRSWIEDGSVSKLIPQRAASLGLDVSRAEDLLGYDLPTCQEVIASLISEAREAGLFAVN